MSKDKALPKYAFKKIALKKKKPCVLILIFAEMRKP